MNRVTIFGSPGSGKTEFSERLSVALNTLNVYHLDEYFWKPGWIKTTQKERLDILEKMTTQDSWIIEGNFSNIVDYQLAVTKSVIYIKLPVLVCLWRVIKRRLSYLSKDIPEIAPSCPDKISYKLLKSVWKYPSTDGIVLQKKLEAKKHKLQVFTLNSQAEMTSFLKRAQVKLW